MAYHMFNKHIVIRITGLSQEKHFFWLKIPGVPLKMTSHFGYYEEEHMGKSHGTDTNTQRPPVLIFTSIAFVV